MKMAVIGIIWSGCFFEGTYFCAPSVGKIDLSLRILSSYALARDTVIWDTNCESLLIVMCSFDN